jgi:UDP-2-acetamido-2,6-beta-L-arabino-hexul-4-ose reductase
MDIANHFPVKFCTHRSRGAFVENNSIECWRTSFVSQHSLELPEKSFSYPQKIERFAVIKGKALIQLRQIGTHSFYLNGEPRT